MSPQASRSGASRSGGAPGDGGDASGDSGWVTAALIVVACGCSAMLALYACLLVPLRLGGRLAPIAVLLAVVTTAGIPQLLLRLRAPIWGAALPYLVWLAVVFYVSQGTSEGDVILPGGGGTSYVAYGVMLLGFLAGIVSLGWRSIVPRSLQ